MFFLSWIVSVVLVLQGCDGFRALSTINKWSTIRQQSLSLSNNDHQPESMRQREVGPLQRQWQSLPWLTAVVVGVTTFRPTVANAGKQDEANAKLAAYGLPPILFVPPGFTPLVSEFGRGNIREAMTNPIIVQFSHPGLWIESLTTVNTNGEAGTVSANDYIKGDSAFFFNQPMKAGETLSEASKELVTNFIKKSLSQKGDPLETFKVVALKKGPVGADGQPYYIADIAYTLNTEAGFLIGRKGVVSLTNVGPFMQALICVATDKRYKNNEGDLRDIANSFRIYKLKSGIFSSGIIPTNSINSSYQVC